MSYLFVIGREAISRFFVDMNGDGQIEDVEQQAHTEEGGGLNGFGAFVLPKSHQHHQHHQHLHHGESAHLLTALMRLDIHNGIHRTLVNDAARNHSESQHAGYHKNRKQQHRIAEKAIFDGVHIVDGKI